MVNIKECPQPDLIDGCGHLFLLALSHKLCKFKIPGVATPGIFLYNFKNLHSNEKRRFIKRRFPETV
jgi:hypothetical protein